MQLFMYACMYAYMYACMHVCMHVCMCVCTYVYLLTPGTCQVFLAHGFEPVLLWPFMDVISLSAVQKQPATLRAGRASEMPLSCLILGTLDSNLDSRLKL